jgi:hypothetical protein
MKEIWGMVLSNKQRIKKWATHDSGRKSDRPLDNVRKAEETTKL